MHDFINLFTHLFIAGLRGGSQADALGEFSSSQTNTELEMLNGLQRASSQSQGTASGRGRSVARSEATVDRVE